MLAVCSVLLRHVPYKATPGPLTLQARRVGPGPCTTDATGCAHTITSFHGSAMGVWSRC